MEAESKRLTDKQSRLVAKTWKRALQAAQQQKSKYPHINLDWEGIAAEAMCDAVTRFDPTREVAFSAFAITRIRYAFVDAMRDGCAKGFTKYGRHGTSPAVVSLSHVIAFDFYGDPMSFAELLSADELPIGWETDSIDTVEGILTRLPQGYREAMRLYYCHGLNFKQIAKHYGVHHKTIAEVHHKALEMLRHYVRPNEAIAS